MKQQYATRKYEDDQYGLTGYWYFHWSALNCVFRTDYPDVKFNLAEDAEELTLNEYFKLSLKYKRMEQPSGDYPRMSDSLYSSRINHPQNNGGPYYYYHDPSDTVYKSAYPQVYDEGAVGDILEITLEEYIDYSIRYDQNHEDTLI